MVFPGSPKRKMKGVGYAMGIDPSYFIPVFSKSYFIYALNHHLGKIFFKRIKWLPINHFSMFCGFI